MKKRIKDLEDFALLDPTFFIALKSANTCFADFTYQTMGMGYYAHSAEKYVTNITQELYEKAPTDAKTYLVNILTAKYGDNWNRLKEAMLDSEYNPISNYDMEEHETPAETTETITPAEITTTTKVPEVTTTITPAETKTETKVPEVNKEIKTPETTITTKVPEVNKEIKVPEQTTKTKIPEQKKTITPTLEKTTTENTTYGYNSSTGVPDSKQEIYNTRVNNGEGVEDIEQGTNAGEEKITQGTNAGAENVKQGTNAGEEKLTQGSNAGAENITQGNKAGEETLTVLDDGVEKVEQGTHAGTDVLTVQTAGTNKYTTQKDRVLTRKGNIGVTTSQQMLQSEIELRKWSFLDSVYSDIDKILTLQTY